MPTVMFLTGGEFYHDKISHFSSHPYLFCGSSIRHPTRPRTFIIPSIITKVILPFPQSPILVVFLDRQ
jgi:hypothetical protein